MGDDVLRRCRPSQRGRKNDGNAQKYKLGHGILLFVNRKASCEPHAKLYASPAQTQLKKYLFGKSFEHSTGARRLAMRKLNFKREQLSLLGAHVFNAVRHWSQALS
jgi:hypothetical protein